MLQLSLYVGYSAVSVTHPLRQLRFFFFFLSFLRGIRIPEFLWGLAQTLPSLILPHVIVGYDHRPYQKGASGFHDSGNRDASVPLFSVFRNVKTRKGLTDRRLDQWLGLNPDILPFGVSHTGISRTRISRCVKMRGSYPLVSWVPKRRNPFTLHRFGVSHSGFRGFHILGFRIPGFDVRRRGVHTWVSWVSKRRNPFTLHRFGVSQTGISRCAKTRGLAPGFPRSRNSEAHLH
jgi:hypothetical protein